MPLRTPRPRAQRISQQRHELFALKIHRLRHLFVFFSLLVSHRQVGQTFLSAFSSFRLLASDFSLLFSAYHSHAPSARSNSPASSAHGTSGSAASPPWSP